MGKTNESILRLSAQFEDLNEALIENGGEITPEIEQQMKDLQMTQEEAAENVRQLLAWNKKQDEFIDEEIKRLQARKKTRKNIAEYFKRRLMETMMAAGVTKIKTDFCSVSVSAGRDSVGCDEAAIKARYIEAAEEAVRGIVPDYIDIDLKVNKTVAMQMINEEKPIPTHMEGQVELPDVYITRTPYLIVR